VLALIVGGSAVLGACSARRPSTRTIDWLLGTPSPSAPAIPTASAPLVYYVGADRLKVYSEPRIAAAVLAQLSLHQKVYCYKKERTYAYVQVEETRLTGWVDKARLISRLPP
jgi:hypothetical protein